MNAKPWLVYCLNRVQRSDLNYSRNSKFDLRKNSWARSMKFDDFSDFYGKNDDSNDFRPSSTNDRRKEKKLSQIAKNQELWKNTKRFLHSKIHKKSKLPKICLLLRILVSGQSTMRPCAFLLNISYIGQASFRAVKYICFKIFIK